MQTAISFVLDGSVRMLDLGSGSRWTPTTTVLQFLRSLEHHRGVKEGCAEGDCGACTIVVAEPATNGRLKYAAVDSCLMFLPMIHRKWLMTIENIASPSGALHPVQQAMVSSFGSQCGFCTPGIIMSLFALYKGGTNPSRAQVEEALSGNLCRCTGYRPIIDAATTACSGEGIDHLTAQEPEVIRLLESIPDTTVRISADGQRYLRPASLSEAVAWKHAHPDALIIGGATDVALRVTKQHELLPDILDISSVEDHTNLRREHDRIIVGAGMPLSELKDEIRTELPALHDMLEVYGSRQIRNLATLGGNLGSASPIGDALPVLMAYDARVSLESLNGRREVPVIDFITGYRATVRRPEELITQVIIPVPANNTTVRSYKISKRKDLDISTVSAGFSVTMDSTQRVDSITLAFGGMAEQPRRARITEAKLVGGPWTRQSIERAMKVLEQEFTPISDVRGSAEFRRIAARNLLMKFWLDTTTA